MKANSIYPCLWFNGNAREFADTYIPIFGGEILQDNGMVIMVKWKGSKLMLLNGGPLFKFSPAVSLFMYCENDDAFIQKVYDTVTNGGKIVMPLDKYNWSPKYAWVEDKFGVNWQLDIEDIKTTQKIAPSLLFVNDKNSLVKEAMHHYTSAFSDHRITMEAPYFPGSGMPDDALLFAQYKLQDFVVNSMSSTLEHDYDFTPATSIVIECDTQEEIDHFWNHLGKDGQYSQCGWLTDKYGFSWQIVPSILSTLMSDPNKNPKVVEAFMKMTKFIIKDLI